jgi:soluble lytic murein transglycosylase-like protein
MLFVPHPGRMSAKHDSSRFSPLARMKPLEPVVTVETEYWLEPRVAYEALIIEASKEFGVDPALVRAVARMESGFDPMAVSSAGAQGLMQLMPATARRFGVTDSYNAGQNIRGGAQYLSWLLKRFNGNLTLAAAGYNAGEGAVDRHGGVPPYKETQRYVQRVVVLADRYRQAVAAR